MPLTYISIHYLLTYVVNSIIAFRYAVPSSREERRSAAVHQYGTLSMDSEYDFPTIPAFPTNFYLDLPVLDGYPSFFLLLLGFSSTLSAER